MKIWIDLDNTPHVPFFAPIIGELEKRGHRVVVTARDCFQVCGLAELHRLRCRTIGRHYGARKVMKVIGTIWRALQLLPQAIAERPALSVSHGSRAMIIASKLLGIPTVLLYDYEFARMLPFVRPELGIAPDAIARSGRRTPFKRGLQGYPGLKEDVYIPFFRPDPAFPIGLGIGGDDIVATIRPPADEAHYHNPESERLFVAVVNRLGKIPSVRMIIVPRNEQNQGRYIRSAWPRWCGEGKIILPDRPVNGLDLLWHSDFVVSGGGTMNREAAALGVPAYSIFRGALGAVDRELAEQGRLTLLATVADVHGKLRIERRSKSEPAGFGERPALKQIVDAIVNAPALRERCLPDRRATRT